MKTLGIVVTIALMSSMAWAESQVVCAHERETSYNAAVARKAQDSLNREIQLILSKKKMTVSAPSIAFAPAEGVAVTVSICVTLTDI